MADRDIPNPENPWVPMEDYTPEALAACEKALRTIVSRIGAWGPRLILFGGLAPRYIVASPPAEMEELGNAGFREGEDGSWAWERRVDGVRVVLEFFCPVEPDGRPGTLRRNPGGETGSSISAIQLRGAEIAAADCAVRTLSGEVLDEGGHRDVEVRVVNVLPFLVLKAFALESRDKEKDAYDIVWTLKAFGDWGPASAADAAAESPIADQDEVLAALEILEHSFSDPLSQGPSNYARFFLGAAGEEEARMRLRRDAQGTIRAFLSRWRSIRSG